MKAIVIPSFGGPDVLQLQEVPAPVPAAGEALVRIAAAGVNYRDVYERMGRYGGTPPIIAGAEGAGTVEALGDGVRDVRVGDRVAFTGIPRACAEYVVAPADRLIPLPDGLSMIEGAAFSAPRPDRPLSRSRVLPCDAADDRARTRCGGRSWPAARADAQNDQRARDRHDVDARKGRNRPAAGADDVILYTQTNCADAVKGLTQGAGVDLVLDGVGKSTLPGSLESVRTRGTVVIFGSSSGPADPVVPGTLQARSLTLAGGTLPNFIATREELVRRSSDVLGAIQSGKLDLRIDRTLPLAQAAEAHRLLESRTTSGKLVLVV